MPVDLHVCGQIVGGSGFHAPEVSCSWRLIHDLSSWMHIAGPAQGKTHIASFDCGLALWAYPLALQLRAVQGAQAWPRLLLKVFSLHGSMQHFQGYALCSLPCTPGCHELMVPCWRVKHHRSGLADDISSSCTGQWPQLEDEAHVCQAEQRQAAAEMVHSCHTGWVHLQLHCLTQNFDQLSHEDRSWTANLVSDKSELQATLEQAVTGKIAAVSGTRPLAPLTEGMRQVRQSRTARFEALQTARNSLRSQDPATLDPAQGRSEEDMAAMQSNGQTTLARIRQQRLQRRADRASLRSTTPGPLPTVSQTTQEPLQPS